MKTATLILIAGLTAGLVLAAEPPVQTADPTNAPPAEPDMPAVIDTNQIPAAVAVADTNAPHAAAVSDTNAPAAPATSDAETNIAAPIIMEDGSQGLRLNFRGAPLELVLEKLSEAAGFIIVLEAQPRGRVDIISNQPITKDEAFSLLNTVLRKNGYTAIRNGRTLTIVNRDEAKTKDIPVNLGSDPTTIPRTDELVTQIIPIQFVEATQLLKDLQPLVSMQTTMTANESGNSIVITDTQANIRRVAEVIKAIDLGAEDVTEVRTFKLTYADPVEMADLLTQLFPDESRTGGQQGQGGFRSLFRGFGGPGGPGGGNTGGGSGNQRIKKRTRVITVADQRTASIVVTAAKDLMGQIADVVQDLDTDPAKKQNVKVFSLQNADPEQALQVLQDIFQKNTTVNNRNSQQNSALRSRSNQQQQSTIGNSRTSGNRTGNRTSGFGQ
jgi:general secretion pathway protein D